MERRDFTMIKKDTIIFIAILFDSVYTQSVSSDRYVVVVNLKNGNVLKSEEMSSVLATEFVNSLHEKLLKCKMTIEEGHE